MVCIPVGLEREGTIPNFSCRNCAKGTLGSPGVDQYEPFPRVRKDVGGTRHPVQLQDLLPPDVSLEQRHVLQTPSPCRLPLLLAHRAQCQVLLRCRLRCVPIHGGWQQDLRLHHQPIRCATEYPQAMARDSAIPRCQPVVPQRQQHVGVDYG